METSPMAFGMEKSLRLADKPILINVDALGHRNFIKSRLDMSFRK